MHMCNADIVKSDRGQIMVIFALVLPILILFAGLAIDAGICYVTKAKLSTSVDAACLTGMKNLAAGQTTAGQLATDMFQANFGPNPPVPTVTFPTDIYNDQQVKVTATSNVHTFFIRYLSQWASVPVSATAVATRGKLVMSIVLDRSGSMKTDGGQSALVNAVPVFVSDFDNLRDEVALISFSSNATVDYAMNYNFITPITNSVKNMTFGGGTFGTGAGTQPILSTTVGAPLSLAKLQDDGVPIQPGQNVVRVLVYFTDGLMNAVQDKFYCGGKGGSGIPSNLVNYGGYDASSGTIVGFLDPNSYDPNQPNGWGYCNSPYNDNCASGLVYNSSGAICRDINNNIVQTFVSQQYGAQYLTRANVTAEAQYRALQTANALRTDAPIPVYIYTIGLGPSVSLATQAFLAQLANDPAYPTYIKGQSQGQFFYIPNCPSSVCTAELNNAFATIATKILLRLTQ